MFFLSVNVGGEWVRNVPILVLQMRCPYRNKSFELLWNSQAANLHEKIGLTLQLIIHLSFKLTEIRESKSVMLWISAVTDFETCKCCWSNWLRDPQDRRKRKHPEGFDPMLCLIRRISSKAVAHGCRWSSWAENESCWWCMNISLWFGKLVWNLEFAISFRYIVIWMTGLVEIQ